MLKSEPLDRVIKLYIHAEVIGIELKSVAGYQWRPFVNFHCEPSNAAIDGKIPVVVPVRLGSHIDTRHFVTGFGGLSLLGRRHKFLRHVLSPNTPCHPKAPHSAARLVHDTVSTIYS